MPDYRSKRLELARRAADAATQIVRATSDLRAVAPLLREAGGSFAEEDVEATDMKHASPEDLDMLVKVVGPALDTVGEQPVGDTDRSVASILLSVARA